MRQRRTPKKQLPLTIQEQMIKLYALDSYMALNRTKVTGDSWTTPSRVKSVKPKERRSCTKIGPIPARHDIDSRKSPTEDNSPLS